jgi:hypothetical protein
VDYGTGRRKNRGVWNRKREEEGSMEPVEGRIGVYGTGRRMNSGLWNRKREEEGSMEPVEG